MTFPFAKLADIHARDVCLGHAHPYHFHRQIRVRGDQRQRRIGVGARGSVRTSWTPLMIRPASSRPCEQGVETPGKRVAFDGKIGILHAALQCPLA